MRTQNANPINQQQAALLADLAAMLASGELPVQPEYVAAWQDIVNTPRQPRGEN